MIAVVGAAFEAWEEATVPRAGIRLTENLDVVDKREEREPGRKSEGEGILGVILWFVGMVLAFCGADPGGRDGEGGGGGEKGGEGLLLISGAGAGGFSVTGEA